MKFRKRCAAHTFRSPLRYDACDKRTGRATSLSLVRYKGTDYSVPTAYAHREVLIRGYPYLPRAEVKTTEASAYTGLLTGAPS